MAALDSFRKRYPQYTEVPDAQLADALYKYSYADKLSREDFDKRLGLNVGGEQSLLAGQVERGKDLAVSAASGVNSLVGLGGSLYGLATGDMDNWATRQGKKGREYWQGKKSDNLLGLEEARSEKVQAADGELAKAGVALWETVSEPMLFSSFLAEQSPMLIPGAAAGRAAGVIAKVAGASTKAAQATATGTAIGTGAGLAAGDAGGQAYEELMGLPEELWAKHPHIEDAISSGASAEQIQALKEEVATSLSRDSASATAVVSLLTNFIPGSRKLEKVLTGGKTTGGLPSAAAGLAGETVQESIEEGFTQLASNAAVQEIDPSKVLTEGVGEAAGQGAVGGVFGAVAGAGRIAPREGDPSPEEFLGARYDEVAADTEGATRIDINGTVRWFKAKKIMDAPDIDSAIDLLNAALEDDLEQDLVDTTLSQPAIAEEDFGGGKAEEQIGLGGQSIHDTIEQIEESTPDAEELVGSTEPNEGTNATLAETVEQVRRESEQEITAGQSLETTPAAEATPEVQAGSDRQTVEDNPAWQQLREAESSAKENWTDARKSWLDYNEQNPGALEESEHPLNVALQNAHRKMRDAEVAVSQFVTNKLPVRGQNELKDGVLKELRNVLPGSTLRRGKDDTRGDIVESGEAGPADVARSTNVVRKGGGPKSDSSTTRPSSKSLTDRRNRPGAFRIEGGRRKGQIERKYPDIFTERYGMDAGAVREVASSLRPGMAKLPTKSANEDYIRKVYDLVRRVDRQDLEDIDLRMMGDEEKAAIREIKDLLSREEVGFRSDGQSYGDWHQSILRWRNQMVGAVAAPTLTVEQVQEAIAPVVARIGDSVLAGVRVITSKRLPAGLDLPLDKNGNKRIPRGYQLGATAYLVADQIGSVGDAQIVLAHELFGHVGVNAIVGDRWAKITESYRGLKQRGGSQFRKIHDRLIAKNGENLSIEREAKEFFALTADARVTEGSVGAFVRRVKEAIRPALRAMGFRNFSLSDIDLIISAGTKYIQTEDMRVEGRLGEVMYDLQETENGYANSFQEFYDNLGDKGLKPRDMLKQSWSRWMESRGGLPQEVFDEHIETMSMFKVLEQDLKHTVALFNRAVEEGYGSVYHQLDESVKEKIDDQLKSTRVDQQIPRSVLRAIVSMRRQIKSLSQNYVEMLVAEIDQLPDGDTKDARGYLMKTVIERFDTYAHRSYKAFDDPNWPNDVPQEVVEDARAYLTERYEELIDEGEMDPIDDMQEHVERKVKLILEEGTAFDGLESFITRANLGAKDLSVTMRRKEIAPEILALLGEYRDAPINYAKTITKMSGLILNHRFLEKVLDIGMDEFLFEEKPTRLKTVQISAEGNPRYAPLDGLWILPEVYQAFEDAMGQKKLEGLYSHIVRANGILKTGKTVYSPTTAARNFMAGSIFAIANGHFYAPDKRKGVFKEYMFQKGEGDFLDYYKHLIELGVLYDGGRSGEMAALMKDARWDEWFDAHEKLIGIREVKAFHEIVQKLYMLGDDYWKMRGFEIEKSRLMKYHSMNVTDAEAEAATRIRNTYPTYSMVPRLVKALRRIPLIGTFPSFSAEIIRTQKNQIKYFLKDREVAPEMAFTRLSGLILAAAAPYAIEAITAMLAGLDDDEEEAIKLMAPEWQRNSNFVYLGRDEDGNPIYIDFSHIDGYSYFKKPWNAVLRDQPWEDKFVDASRELLSPFLGEDIGFGAIREVVSNQTQSGGKVYNEESPPGDQAFDIGMHILERAQPGVTSQATRTVKAFTDKRRPSGKPFEKVDETLAWFGVRMTTSDPKTALRYRAYDFKDSLQNSREILNSVARRLNDVSDGELLDAYDESLQARETAYDEMIKMVSGAKGLGLSDTEIVGSLISAQVSRMDIGALMSGEIPPWNPPMVSMRNAIQRAVLLYDEDVEGEMARRIGLLTEATN